LKLQYQSIAGKSKLRNVPSLLLNLDAEDSEEEYIIPDEGNSGGLTEKEAVFDDTLTKKCSDCQRCRTGVLCKMNRNGLHSCLMFNQINAWAIALICIYPT